MRTAYIYSPDIVSYRDPDRLFHLPYRGALSLSRDRSLDDSADNNSDNFRLSCATGRDAFLRLYASMNKRWRGQMHLPGQSVHVRENRMCDEFANTQRWERRSKGKVQHTRAVMSIRKNGRCVCVCAYGRECACRASAGRRNEAKCVRIPAPTLLHAVRCNRHFSAAAQTYARASRHYI